MFGGKKGRRGIGYGGSGAGGSSTFYQNAWVWGLAPLPVLALAFYAHLRGRGSWVAFPDRNSTSRSHSTMHGAHISSDKNNSYTGKPMEGSASSI